jgi:DoxX-like protein
MKLNEYKESRIKNYALWTVQWLLAMLFLWAGGIKLVLPLEALKGPVALPGLFVRFIGVAEALGAIGLILPWLLRIRPILTPLAAGGLVIIMIGATVITLMGDGGAFALFPATVGILAVSVAYGRGRAVSYRIAEGSPKTAPAPSRLSSTA